MVPTQPKKGGRVSHDGTALAARKLWIGAAPPSR